MGRTLQTMRAFRRDCWLAIACLAVGWLLVQDVTGGGPFNANSNVVLVALVGWFGWQMHPRLFLMRLGPHPVLTPGLERSTTLAGLVLVGSVTLVGAVFCWWFGNRTPAVGPSVLLAAATLTGVHRLYAARTVKWLMQIGAFGVVCMAVAEDEHLRAVVSYAEWLSHPWVQLGSLVAAALACTWRKPLRNRAVFPLRIVPSSPSDRSSITAFGGSDRLSKTVSAMRVFRSEWWLFAGAVLGSSVFAILITASGTHAANANVVVLWLLATVGGVVGNRVAQVRLFPGFLLVEGLVGSITLACCSIIAIACVIGVSLSLTVANWIPPLAPGLFIALAIVLHAQRFAPVQSVTTLGALFIIGAVVWRGNELERFAEFTSALSHPWMQLAALAATIPVVGELRMTFGLPILFANRATVSSPAFSYRQALIKNVTMSAQFLVFMLLFALLLWTFMPDPPGFVYRVVALGWLQFMVISVTDSDLEGQMARDWMLGVANSRLALARRCAAFQVLCVTSWVPVGIVGVVIHGTLLGTLGDSLVDILLLGLIAAFAMIVLRCWTLGRLSDGWQLRTEILCGLLALAGVFVLGMAERGALDYAALVLTAVVTAALAVEVGGRGLARASVLTSPVG